MATCLVARPRHPDETPNSLLHAERGGITVFRSSSSRQPLRQANFFVMLHEESMFDIFGDTDPRKMPDGLFWGARHLDYSTAVRADVSQQNCSICPRHWYIDAAFHCSRCGQSFVFTASEQKFWYEQQKFWIDSIPRECAKCRKELRELKELQQEYDRAIASAMSKSSSVDQKERLVAVVEAMEAGGVTLAAKVKESRRILLSQIEKSRRPGAA